MAKKPKPKAKKGKTKEEAAKKAFFDEMHSALADRASLRPLR